MDEEERVALTYAAAVFERDAARLAALYDGDVVAFDLWERWPYRGCDA